MANKIENRPNFKLAIDDPSYFIGRGDILKDFCQDPREIRILLGGRRIGKTSFLHALQWSLLDPNRADKANRAFPVLINLQVEQPTGIDNLRYLLITRLREAIERWRRTPGAKLREMYKSYLRQVVDGEVGIQFLQVINAKVKVENLDRERRLIHDDFRQATLRSLDELKEQEFNGICFIFDSAEFIARQKWASDAWSYFRGLKDTEPSLKPFIGFVLSGYRELKEYQQAVGSPLLNIADIRWMEPLTDSEVRDLIIHRQHEEGLNISDKGIALLMDWTGGHPYLTQQVIDLIFDKFRENEIVQPETIKGQLLQQHDYDFTRWWNVKQEVGGLSDDERNVYHTLIKKREGTVSNLASHSSMSPLRLRKALEVLVGTGIIQKSNSGVFQIGSSLFEDWVRQQHN